MMDDSSDRGMFELVETIEQLSKAETIEAVAAIIRTAARRIADADGACFVLRDGDFCWYLDEEAIGPLWKGRRFPLQTCISGWAMLNGQTAVIPDIYVDPRIPHDAYRPTFVNSLVMTPVRPGDPIAAIGAYWARTGTPEPRAIACLQAISRATATALANVKLIASLRDSIERRDFLIRELDHRVKNTLTSVLSMYDLTLPRADDLETFTPAFRARLHCMAKGHEYLAARRWRDGDLEEMVRLALAPFLSDSEQLTVEGPAVRLRPETAISFLLVCHELAANARHYGALSVPRGRVDVRWSARLDTAPESLAFAWRELDGPEVIPPVRRGFGSELIERGFAREVDGIAQLDFAPSGLRFTLTAPVSERLRLEAPSMADIEAV